MGQLSDYVVFKDEGLRARFAQKKIPIDTLFEAYFDDALDIPGDIYALLRDRHAFVEHKFTPAHVRYFLTRFVPEFTVHSKQLDEKLVRWHYDRGNDFFSAFLGPRMVYTSGFFTDSSQSVEQGQDQKMDMVCRKLMLKPGETLLDIGCGWGTLALHAAKHYGVRSTGVTLSRNQAEYGNAAIAKAGLSDKAKIVCVDYRDTPGGRYDKIVSLEMVEHVGVKNLGAYYKKVYDLLSDEGLFCLQWTGLRRGSNMEDLVWGLFMAKYIFAGADASLPLAPMAAAMEKAGFEIHSVENVSIHYHFTIKKWHDNWLEHKAEIVKAYGERWFRIWHVFLSWAATIAAQGTAACFQIISNKNLNTFDRTMWIDAPTLGGLKFDASKVRRNESNGPTNGHGPSERVSAESEAELSPRPGAPAAPHRGAPGPAAAPDARRPGRGRSPFVPAPAPAARLARRRGRSPPAARRPRRPYSSSPRSTASCTALRSPSRWRRTAASRRGSRSAWAE